MIKVSTYLLNVHENSILHNKRLKSEFEWNQSSQDFIAILHSIS
jgi:transposase-like protein